MHMIAVNLSSLFKTVIKDSIFEQNIEQRVKLTNLITFATLSPTQYLLKQEGLYKLKTPLPGMVHGARTTAAPGWVFSFLINLWKGSEKNWTKLLCHGGELMDGVIQASDPYIYPCTIQYCLITAGGSFLYYIKIIIINKTNINNQ